MAEQSFLYMNAAGPCGKTVAQVQTLAEIPCLTHIVVGSFTVEARDGNVEGTNFVVLPDGTSVNALGLPNGGLPFLKAHGREMVHIAHDAGKKLVVSGAWFTPEDAGILAATAVEIGADIFEDNSGCPNVFDGGRQKAIPSFHIPTMMQEDAVLERIVGSDIEIWKKLSPFTSPEERLSMATYLQTLSLGAVVLCNTLPNARPRDEAGKPLITARDTNGFGGLGGTGLKHISLANAEHFRELLPERIAVIGVGGITTPADIRDYLHAGCVGVQVGTVFFWKNRFATLENIGNWAFRRHIS